MTDHRTKQQSPMVYHMGKMNHDRYWIQCPDGRMLLIDSSAKHVLERLARQECISSIRDDLGIEKDDIDSLLDGLRLQPDSIFTILYHSSPTYSSHQTDNLDIPFFCPWIGQRWFAWFVLGTGTLSLVLLCLFIKHVPVQFVWGLNEQWLVAGLLTLSVLLHETGHLCAMPRHRNISIFIHWSGPLPMLSILCNEAWKLPKWHRMRINLAGLIADIIVSGLAAGLGLWAARLSPWVWTFLAIHLIRMLVAIWPFLPGDGYWILVDLLDRPNLWPTALSHIKQGKMSWLSLYAAFRLLFLLFVWAIWMLIVYRLLVMVSAQPQEALSVLCYPAPLLAFLTVLGQLCSFTSTWYKRQLIPTKSPPKRYLGF